MKEEALGDCSGIKGLSHHRVLGFLRPYISFQGQFWKFKVLLPVAGLVTCHGVNEGQRFVSENSTFVSSLVGEDEWPEMPIIDGKTRSREDVCESTEVLSYREFWSSVRDFDLCDPSKDCGVRDRPVIDLVHAITRQGWHWQMLHRWNWSHSCHFISGLDSVILHIRGWTVWKDSWLIHAC